MLDQAAQHSIDNALPWITRVGTAQQGRVDERHVTGGAIDVDGRHAKATADFGRTGFRQRKNHRCRAAGRFTYSDRALGWE